MQLLDDSYALTYPPLPFACAQHPISSWYLLFTIQERPRSCSNTGQFVRYLGSFRLFFFWVTQGNITHVPRCSEFVHKSSFRRFRVQRPTSAHIPLDHGRLSSHDWMVFSGWGAARCRGTSQVHPRPYGYLCVSFLILVVHVHGYQMPAIDGSGSWVSTLIGNLSQEKGHFDGPS